MVSNQPKVALKAGWKRFDLGSHYFWALKSPIYQIYVNVKDNLSSPKNSPDFLPFLSTENIVHHQNILWQYNLCNVEQS